MWERYDRKSAGGSYRYSAFLEWVTIFPGGIRFSRPAKERWLGDRPFVDVYVDREAGDIAFKSLETPGMSSFKVSQQGAIKQGKPNYYIPCRSAVNFWRKGMKGRFLCTLVDAGDGLVQLIPETKTIAETVIEDGFGSECSERCPECDRLSMEVGGG
jgi:hypothetical protein